MRVVVAVALLVLAGCAQPASEPSSSTSSSSTAPLPPSTGPAPLPAQEPPTFTIAGEVELAFGSLGNRVHRIRLTSAEEYRLSGYSASGGQGGVIPPGLGYAFLPVGEIPDGAPCSESEIPLLNDSRVAIRFGGAIQGDRDLWLWSTYETLTMTFTAESGGQASGEPQQVSPQPLPYGVVLQTTEGADATALAASQSMTAELDGDAMPFFAFWSGPSAYGPDATASLEATNGGKVCGSAEQSLSPAAGATLVQLHGTTGNGTTVLTASFATSGLATGTPRLRAVWMERLATGNA